jgi:hypothetical protein
MQTGEDELDEIASGALMICGWTASSLSKSIFKKSESKKIKNQTQRDFIKGLTYKSAEVPKETLPSFIKEYNRGYLRILKHQFWNSAESLVYFVQTNALIEKHGELTLAAVKQTLRDHPVYLTMFEAACVAPGVAFDERDGRLGPELGGMRRVNRSDVDE